jgi:hypothetical protein
MISWPGTAGYDVKPHSLRAKWRSEWQTPQYWMSIWTSVGPGSRREMVVAASGDFAAVAE